MPDTQELEKRLRDACDRYGDCPDNSGKWDCVFCNSVKALASAREPREITEQEVKAAAEKLAWIRLEDMEHPDLVEAQLVLEAAELARVESAKGDEVQHG